MTTQPRIYTSSEDEFIRANYRDLTASEIGRQLNRSERSIWKRARKLGLAECQEPVHRQKIAVAQEFGCPFSDVCRYFAEAGHSRADTARILGMRRETFRMEVQDLGIEWPDRNESGARLTRGRRRSAETIAKLKAYAMTRAHLVELDGVTDSVRGHCRRLGIPRWTVKYRRAAGYSWEQAFGLKPLAGRSYARNTKNHPWRQAEQQRLDEIRARGPKRPERDVKEVKAA